MLKDIFDFLRDPKEMLPVKKELTFYSSFWKHLKFILLMTFSFGSLIFLISLFDPSIHTVIAKRDEKTPMLILLSTLFYPFFEEVGFRLHLKVTRLNLAISFSIQTIYLFFLFDFFGMTNLIIALLSIFPLALLFYFVINPRIITYLKKEFRFFFYYNLLFFTLLHLVNYRLIEPIHYLYVLIVLSLPFLMGTYLSYIRLKIGFLFCVLIHICFNLFLNIPYIIAYYPN